MTSTTHMLRVMKQSAPNAETDPKAEKPTITPVTSMEDEVLSTTSSTPVKDSEANDAQPQLTPSTPTLVDVLAYCLNPKNNNDNTPR